MSDARIRALEREAAAGDPLAEAALARARRRVTEAPAISVGSVLCITPDGDVVPAEEARGISTIIGFAAETPSEGGAVRVNLVAGGQAEFFV